MAPARLPFWLPIVAPTLPNDYLCKALGMTGASKVALLRMRYGLAPFLHDPRGPLSINWISLLGMIEDEVLADLVTQKFAVLVTPQLVRFMRDELGHLSYNARKRKLDPQIRDLIGQYSTIHISKGWDIDPAPLDAYRQLAGINSIGQDLDIAEPGRRWPQEWIELFHHQSNAQVSRKTGYGIDQVRAKRRSLRIAAPRVRTYWKVVDACELGQATDIDLAVRYGGPASDYAAQRLSLALQKGDVAEQLLAQQRLPNSLEHFLNEMPTQRLARITGLSMYTLKKQREAAGLHAYSPLPLEADGLFATMRDAEIAARFNVSVATVRYRRRKVTSRQ